MGWWVTGVVMDVICLETQATKKRMEKAKKLKDSAETYIAEGKCLRAQSSCVQIGKLMKDGLKCKHVLEQMLETKALLCCECNMNLYNYKTFIS